MQSKLFLIPCSIGNNPSIDSISDSIRSSISNIDHYIVEHEKKARLFIKKVCPEKDQKKIKIFEIKKHIKKEETKHYLDYCRSGIDMGLMSDAGCPCIADPGALIVERAHQMNIIVKPLAGPSSIILGMMGSGMNGQNFAFNGYLPINKAERKKALRVLEKKSQKQNQTQIFIETPYRNEKMFDQLISSLCSETLLSIAYNLTENDEFQKTLSVKNWRKREIKFNKKPAIFCIHKKTQR